MLAPDRIPAPDANASPVAPARRIAMVIQRFRPYFSGQGIQLEELCRALARRGRQSTILTAIRGRPSEWETCSGYTVRRVRADLLPGSGSRQSVWAPMYGVRVLHELLRMQPVDVVHVHGLHDGLYGAALFCHFQKVPLVLGMTLMGVDDPTTVLAMRQRLALLRRRAYLSADAYVAMSRAFLPAYARSGLDSRRLTVVPQGVDTTRFRPLTPAERLEVRTEISCDHEGPLVAFLGSLIERKGLDVLLTAWEAVQAVVPGARLMLIGHDTFAEGAAEHRFLDDCLGRLSAEARHSIIRLGVLDEPAPYLGAADLFVLPSRREGFGTAIIEAMACGLPAIVARLDGITDFIFADPARLGSDAHGDGIIVPQEDPQTLAAEMIALLSDTARTLAIGRAGRERVRTHFDLHDVVAPAYDAVYSKVIERGR